MSLGYAVPPRDAIADEIERGVRDLRQRVEAAGVGLSTSPAARTLWRDVVSYAASYATATAVATLQPAGVNRVTRELHALGLPTVRTLLVGARTSYLIRCVRAGYAIWPTAKALGVGDISTFSRSMTAAFGVSPKRLTQRYGPAEWTDRYLRQHLTDLAPLWQVFLREPDADRA